MSFHTVAYYTASLGTTITAIPGVADTIFPAYGNGLLLPDDRWLIAAYAGNASLVRARLNAPSLLRVGYPSIRPVQGQATAGRPLPDPNLMVLLDHPLLLRSSEALGVDGAAGTGGTPAVALMWLADRLEPAPPGDSFWLRFTSATAFTTANAWNVIAPVYDQAIPSGVYAVLGLEFFSTTAIAARVVFPGSAGSVQRPGVLAQNGDSAGTAGTARTHRIFYEGCLGVFGTFQTNAPPNIEVLPSASSDSAGSMEGYLRVVRIGEVGASPPSPMGPGRPSGEVAVASSLMPHVSVAAGYGPGKR